MTYSKWSHTLLVLLSFLMAPTWDIMEVIETLWRKILQFSQKHPTLYYCWMYWKSWCGCKRWENGSIVQSWDDMCIKTIHVVVPEDPLMSEAFNSLQMIRNICLSRTGGLLNSIFVLKPTIYLVCPLVQILSLEKWKKSWMTSLLSSIHVITFSVQWSWP